MNAIVPAGCTPPENLAALQACYDDLAKAMAFVSALMVDLLNNDPAVAEATIQAIEKSGAALPLLGVTNGTDAVSPQVGEYIQLSGTLAYTATPAGGVLSLGVLPPGDWDCWLWATFTSGMQGATITFSPLPAGFAANLVAGFYFGPTAASAILQTMTVRALVSVDTLIPVDAQAAAISGQSGTMTVNLGARRRR